MGAEGAELRCLARVLFPDGQLGCQQLQSAPASIGAASNKEHTNTAAEAYAASLACQSLELEIAADRESSFVR